MENLAEILNLHTFIPAIFFQMPVIVDQYMNFNNIRRYKHILTKIQDTRQEKITELFS